MIDNPFSGTLSANNINRINKLYEMMKDALIQQTISVGLTSCYAKGNGIPIFTTTNMADKGNPAKMFYTVKGNKIFNIVKHPNQRRKTIMILNEKGINESHERQDDVKEEQEFEKYPECSEDELEDQREIKQDQFYGSAYNAWEGAFK